MIWIFFFVKFYYMYNLPNYGNIIGKLISWSLFRTKRNRFSVPNNALYGFLNDIIVEFRNDRCYETNKGFFILIYMVILKFFHENILNWCVLYFCSLFTKMSGSSIMFCWVISIKLFLSSYISSSSIIAIAI